MTSLKDFAEAEKRLGMFVPLADKVTGRDITIDRMWPLMAAFGNPHEKLKIVHIAGTSGKTSTAYYIAHLLHLSGKKVGLTVSPHVDSVAERVQINMQPLAESEFVNALNEFLFILEQTDLKPTYFELLVCFAYWYFAKVNVDYAVVETGLGGLQDGTNVAKQAEKLCVITDIGLDHMHILGSTVEEIARQKAGIIHTGNTAIMLPQPENVLRVFRNWCTENDANLEVVQPINLDSNAYMAVPEFQRRNWSLAYAAFQFLKDRDGLIDIDINASLHVYVPGRMDAVQVQGKTVVMDGAHNEQKMQAFVTSFQKKYPGKKVPVLLSLKLGKELGAVLPLLKPITTKLYITTYEHFQDLPVPSIDAHELSIAAERFGFEHVFTETDRNKAYDMFIQEQGDLAIITGSFYLIGQLRNSHPELCQKS